jgi:hypothetical protein
VPDPGGWDKLRWGLTPDQVRAVYPALKPVEPNTPAALFTQLSEHGATAPAQYWLERVPLQDGQCWADVGLHFTKASQLYAAVLTLNWTDQTDGAKILDGVEAGLQARYGKPAEYRHLEWSRLEARPHEREPGRHAGAQRRELRDRCVSA